MHPYKHISLIEDFLPVLILTVTFLNRYYVLPILEMKKPRLREVKCHIPSHKATNCQHRDMTLEVSYPPFVLLYELSLLIYLRASKREENSNHHQPTGGNNCPRKDKSHHGKA